MFKTPNPFAIALFCVGIAVAMVGLPIAAIAFNAPWPVILVSTVPFVTLLGVMVILAID